MTNTMKDRVLIRAAVLGDDIIIRTAGDEIALIINDVVEWDERNDKYILREYDKKRVYNLRRWLRAYSVKTEGYTIECYDIEGIHVILTYKSIEDEFEE